MSQIVYVNSSLLSFDKENPRLVEFAATTNEDQILDCLWDNMAIDELVMSILAQGFFEHEPLYVVPSADGKYIVIEGNRRLAAIRSILSPEKVKSGRMSKFVSRVTPELAKKLQESIPVIVLEKKEDAWRLLGFKHVNGPAKWGSYAKAKYISTVHNSFGVSLDDIAEQIGDTHDVVRKLYQGLMILEQAQRQTDFDIKDICADRIYFSHLYTALGYEKFRIYLGLNGGLDSENPIPTEKLSSLQEVMDWLFGSKKRGVEQVVKTQNPYLRKLIDVLDQEMSVAALRAGSSIEVAYDLSINGADALRYALVRAKLALEKAASKMGDYDASETLLKQAGTIANLADSIYSQMEMICRKKEKPTRLTE